MIVGVFVVVASDTTQTYHVAIVGFLACGLVLTTSSVNGLVYSTNGAKEAAAAGFILLSMVTVCLHCLFFQTAARYSLGWHSPRFACYFFAVLLLSHLGHKN